MLNEWSDRAPPGPRKPILASWQFWSGVMTVLVGLAVLVGLFARFSG